MPAAYIARQLALRRIGMRALLEVVPLDCSLVRGSHGRIETGTPYAPVLVGEGLDHLDQSVPASALHDVLVGLCER